MRFEILVYGNDKEDAQFNADMVAQKRIEHHHKGMGHSILENLSEENSRASRRATLPILQVSTRPYPTNDKRGLYLVNSIIEDHRKDFKKSMKDIRRCIASFTDDELFNARTEVIGSYARTKAKGRKTQFPAHLFRHSCNEASGFHQGIFARLYDFKGNEIWCPDQLEPLLNPSWAALRYLDEGDDPYWGEHIWNKPLWAVPFQRIMEPPIV